MSEIQEVKLQAGGYWVKTKTWEEMDRIFFKFGFNRPLLEEIKCMEGARWKPEGKTWHVKNSRRNHFQLDYLLGKDPYQWYDRPLVEYQSSRPVYGHQLHMARHILTYHNVILAAEMGTGKSLAAIEAMEYVGRKDAWWVGPKSALAAVDLEIRKWNSKIIPTFMTYDRLKSMLENWPKGMKAPFFIVFDESSRAKSPTAQRSQAAYDFAEAVRNDWHGEGFVVLMSGSPAPKSPVDWWMQCEIACPGFIKEGTSEKFRKRLGLIVEKEALTGGTYPHLITWKDDEKKCAKCGLEQSNANHDPQQLVFMETTTDYHPFEPSVNEVSLLYQRMKGLVLVYFKKDCLDLPEKQYRVVQCPPRQDTINAAKLIAASAPSTIMALTLLRELSDGFQYQEREIGERDCERCGTTGRIIGPVFTGEGIEERPEAIAVMEDDEIDPQHKQQLLMEMGVGFTELEMSCPECSGAGKVPLVTREAVQVPCPKEDQLLIDLDLHDEDGRLVTYGGFTGSIDRIVRVTEKANWQWIRVDGRGWSSSLGHLSAREMLELFQDKKRAVPKLNFIGQPSSAGMGLTLTESCEIIYYSNDFNAESRIQSEDRIHRMGMDVNRGALITDYVHLPTDQKVIDNLKMKRRLQDLSLGQFQEALKAAVASNVRKF